jgi:hypothetical protein
MSSLKQREKLLWQAKTETLALQTLVKSRNLLFRRRWFNQDQKKGDMCAQMAISEAGSEVQNNVDRRISVSLAMDLLLEEAQTTSPPHNINCKQWISIPHWNDAQKYKKDVLKVFDIAIVKLRKKLQPV